MSKFFKNKGNAKINLRFYFSKILRDVAAEKNVTVGRIVETPAAALVLYHANK